MPFTRMDLETFHPAQVILGHIHAPSDASRYPIYYTGSPCGLDINETGRRRFLTYDTQQRTFESRPVQTEVLFFNETLTILPLENEGAVLRHKAAMLIESWGLSPSEYRRACIRITASGYSNDRQGLMDTLKDCFAGFTFFKDEGPDISAVSISNDPNRGILGEAMLSRIEAQPWPTGMDEPGQEDILLAALGIIYGGKK